MYETIKKPSLVGWAFFSAPMVELVDTLTWKVCG